MKEEKRKSMLTIILPNKNQSPKCSAKKINEPPPNTKFKDTSEQRQSQAKYKFVRNIRLVNTKQTILSFHAEVRESGCETNHPNQIKAQYNRSKHDKQNTQVREMRKKLKRVGKKVWVTAYKQSIEDQIVEQADLANNPKADDEDNKDQYKQFKERGNSAEQNKRIIELRQSRNRSDQNLQQLNQKHKEQIKEQQNEDEQVKTRQCRKMQQKTEEHQSEQSETHSIKIENIQPRKLQECSTKIEKEEELPEIDIDKMLQEIQHDHVGLKYNQKSINEEAKAFGMNTVQTQPCKIEKKSTNYRQDHSSVSKQTPRECNQPAPLMQLRNSKQMLRRNQNSRSYQSFIRNDFIVKNQPMCEQVDMKMTYSRFPRKNSRKLLAPSQHKEEKELEQNSIEKPKVYLKLKKESSLNSISSTIMTNSRVELDKVKLREYKQKQTQPSSNNTTPITQSLHLSQKKEARKLGVQRFKHGETTGDQPKITSSLKKNVKNFEVNRLIAEARKEIIPSNLFA